MFSKSWFELGKEKTLQKLQEQLEIAGIKNDYLDNRVNKALGHCDERLQELMKLVDEVSSQLESLMQAASRFHQGAVLIRDSALSGNKNVVSQEYLQIENFQGSGKDVLRAFSGSFDVGALKEELSKNVIRPNKIKMRELADMKNRIKEIEIVRMEMEVKREAVKRCRNKAKTDPDQIVSAEEQLAQKDIQYNQALLRLLEELEKLKRDKNSIITTAFTKFATCQYRYAMHATASLRNICGEGDHVNFAEENQQPSLTSVSSSDVTDLVPVSEKAGFSDSDTGTGFQQENKEENKEENKDY